MEKTIMTGDRIFGFRLAYGINIDFFGHNYTKKFRDPERFDIVIFKYPDDERKLYIKRVIGLPGEKVQICLLYTSGKSSSSHQQGKGCILSDECSFWYSEDERNHLRTGGDFF